jgi:hypothetical protein
MARPLRIESSGAVYHITSRGNEKICNSSAFRSVPTDVSSMKNMSREKAIMTQSGWGRGQPACGRQG